MKKLMMLSLKAGIIIKFFLLFFLLSAVTLSAPENRILASELIDVSMDSAPFLLPFGVVRPEVSLKGSPESLIWQNYKFDREGLKRIRNDKELDDMISSGELVPLPLGDCLLASDKELAPKWRFVLARAAKLLENISETICPEFGLPVKINGAVRHIPRQIEISRTNLNAAAVSGPKASPHLTGAAIDIAVLGYPEGFVARLKEILLDLESWGAIDATLEENSQNVLHVTVFKEYLNIPFSTH